MINQPTEIAIIGGGMVDGALALGLAQHGFAVMMVEHAKPASLVTDSQPDVRISAISAASVSLLKRLGVQDVVQATHYRPYRRLEMQEWETAHVVFDAAELKLPLFGYMVENTALQQALQQALEAHPRVTLRVPGSLIVLHRHNDLQELEPKDGEVIRARLAIGADGVDSQVRQMAGIDVRAWQYAQLCMLISIQCENNPSGSIWQQFTPGGPRTFLSLFDNWASLVQYDSPTRIRQLQSMNTVQLQTEIAKHSPSRLGYATPPAAGTFPLTRRHALQHMQPGLTLVNDTAHTIHPLTGQGVNLGYRDVDALIDILVNARSYGEAWASYPVLKRYQMQRMADNFIMQDDMDLFYAGFSNNLPPLRFMRDLGLMAAEHASVLKHQALEYALGLQPYDIAGYVPAVSRMRRGSVTSDIEG